MTAGAVARARPVHDRAFLERRGLDLDLAFQCVELAALAYRDPETAAERACARFRYQSCAHVSRRQGRDHVLVVRDARRTIVAFRGSDDLWDWLTNLQAWTAATPFGRVHRGYFLVLQSLVDELQDLITGDERRRPVVFTGHSMGGALAVLAGAVLDADRYPAGGIYTFGQPHVGRRDFNRRFLARYPAPLFRFVNGADAIAAWTYGQRALLGTPCYFDQHGHLVFGERLSEVPRLSLRFHRLEHYRHYLRLNRLRLRAREQSDVVTVVLRR